MEEKKFKRGMVFGVFDGLHPGHRYFLTQAQERCEKLAVVVAPDHIVIRLKGRSPEQPEAARLRALQEFDGSIRVVFGDRELGSWKIFEKEKPDIIFLGYDQQPLSEELRKLDIPFQTIPPHEPEKYKTSLLK